MTSQLHDPYRTASDLNNSEGEVDALYDRGIDRPFRCICPFLVATPGESVKAQG